MISIHYSQELIFQVSSPPALVEAFPFSVP